MAVRGGSLQLGLHYQSILRKEIKVIRIVNSIVTQVWARLISFTSLNCKHTLKNRGHTWHYVQVPCESLLLSVLLILILAYPAEVIPLRINMVRLERSKQIIFYDNILLSKMSMIWILLLITPAWSATFR